MLSSLVVITLIFMLSTLLNIFTFHVIVKNVKQQKVKKNSHGILFEDVSPVTLTFETCHCTCLTHVQPCAVPFFPLFEQVISCHNILYTSILTGMKEPFSIWWLFFSFSMRTISFLVFWRTDTQKTQVAQHHVMHQLHWVATESCVLAGL